MSNFGNSHWSDSSFAQEYRDQADGYVPERRKLIEIAQSLYRHLVGAVSLAGYLIWAAAMA